tara:strand:- start:380 stop:1090 length:711 start_codon:yes stop_codon:yes gene_type:complete
MNTGVVLDIGLMEYRLAWDLQKYLHDQVSRKLLPELLLLVEHPHVYTLGRRGNTIDILISQRAIKNLGIEVHHVDRGGEVTYHGPGQLVGYPIVNLRERKMGPLDYVRSIEIVLSETLKEYGIDSYSADMPTGVWVGGSKIAAIGVKVSRGVTAHGFALNVVPDLSYFNHIVPCGIKGAEVTSMASVGKCATDIKSVSISLSRHFESVFGIEMEMDTLEGFERRFNFSVESIRTCT